jgi:hypothetical protein
MTGDTGAGVSYLDPSIAIIAASFGYDMEADEAVETTFGTSTSNPSILIVMANQAWSGSFADTENACIAALETGGSQARAGWVANFTTQLFGFSYDTFTTVEDDCEGTLDPNDYPDFGATMASADWAVSIAAEVSSSYADLLREQAGFEDEDFETLIGGGFGGDIGGALSQSGLVVDVLVSANAVNENFGVELNDDQSPVELTGEEMVVEGVLQSGQYNPQLVAPPQAIDALY